MSADPSPFPRHAGTAPAVPARGFRPFFLCGALYAAGLVAVWVPWFLGFISLDVDFPPVAWHAHELLFGFVPAMVAGFLPTAGPDRSGHRPSGWLPAGLSAAWVAGRLGVAASSTLGPPATALVTLLFPLMLAALAGREIAAGNRRNPILFGVLCILIGAQILFHWELWRFGQSVYGTRLAVAVMVMPIMLAGGWNLPNSAGPNSAGLNLTGTLPNKRGVTRWTPFSPRFDGLAAGLGLLALIAWVMHGSGRMDGQMTGALLLAAGVAQSVRLARWRHRGLAGPPVFILHVTHAFVPAGFLFAAWASFTGSPAYASAAMHAWTAGAIGGMMLAAAARTALASTASWPTVMIHVAVTVAAAARIAAALAPQQTMLLMPLSGIAWIVAFLLFGIAHGRRSPTGP